MFRRTHKAKKQLSGGDLTVEEITIPTHFRCPVSLDLMKDPVTLSTGITYDRVSIEKWIESGNKTCPVTNQKLLTFEITPNHTIRKMIQSWCVENSSYGIERIPTPRIPVSSYEVSEVYTRLLSGCKSLDEKKCVEFVGKIKVWWRESERNKRVIVGNGAFSILATVFDSFSCVSFEKHVVILEEILEILTWMVMTPFGETKSRLFSSSNSLSCLVWFLDGKDLGARQNAVLLLKEIMNVEELSKVEGVVEGLIKIIKEPIGSSATKACLTTIFKLVSSTKNRVEIGERFVELGLVSFLLETIVDGEKRICEKALGVLDCLCDFKKGNEVIKMNALTLPLVIKKLLRVSPLASSFVVGIVRKIVCEKKEERVLIEAIQLGAFQKLLVMLQVGCEEKTKENTNELLKLLNGYRSKAECVDSSLDFKYLKN
ncbi:U-box domain-containing protein [Trifolium repens]|nr:U-box domain-containing protein [Trifolium repens]